MAVRNVLVLGSKIPGVSSADWFSGQLPNIADFDVLMVNAVSLGVQMRKDEEEDLSAAQYEHWSRRLDSIRERVRKLLKSGGIVIAVADRPVVRVTEHDVEKLRLPDFIGSDYWLPIPLSFVEENGKTIEIMEDDFQDYMQSVSDWHYHLQVDTDDRRDLVGEMTDEYDGVHLEVELQALATNRQGLPIAAAVQYLLHRGDHNSWHSTAFDRSGSVIVLPPQTNMGVDDMVMSLLQQFAEFEPRTIEPDFVKSMRVVGEDALDEDLSRNREQAESVAARIADVEAERTRKRAFLRLVFEKGIAGLQDAARLTFDEMGLKTWDADADVSDEFMVGDGTNEFLVEVKGHRKSAQQEDVRQLDESMDQFEKKFARSVKGVLIVNAWCELDVDVRDKSNTKNFPDGVIKRAEAIDVALISGVSLFSVLNAFWDGKVSGQEVFDKIFQSAGIVPLQ